MRHSENANVHGPIQTARGGELQERRADLFALSGRAVVMIDSYTFGDRLWRIWPEQCPVFHTLTGHSMVFFSTIRGIKYISTVYEPWLFLSIFNHSFLCAFTAIFAADKPFGSLRRFF